MPELREAIHAPGATRAQVAHEFRELLNELPTPAFGAAINGCLSVVRLIMRCRALGVEAELDDELGDARLYGFVATQIERYYSEKG